MATTTALPARLRSKGAEGVVARVVSKTEAGWVVDLAAGLTAHELRDAGVPPASAEGSARLPAELRDLDAIDPPRVGASVVVYVLDSSPDRQFVLASRPYGKKRPRDCYKQLVRAFARHGGTLPLGPRSSPAEVRDMLNMSKSQFRGALSALVRARGVVIDEAGNTVTFVPKPARKKARDAAEPASADSSASRGAARASHKLKALEKGRRRDALAASKQAYALLLEGQPLEDLSEDRKVRGAGAVRRRLEAASAAAVADTNLRASVAARASREGGGASAREVYAMEDPWEGVVTIHTDDEDGAGGADGAESDPEDPMRGPAFVDEALAGMSPRQRRRALAVGRSAARLPPEAARAPVGGEGAVLLSGGPEESARAQRRRARREAAAAKAAAAAIADRAGEAAAPARPREVSVEEAGERRELDSSDEWEGDSSDEWEGDSSDEWEGDSSDDSGTSQGKSDWSESDLPWSDDESDGSASSDSDEAWEDEGSESRWLEEGDLDGLSEDEDEEAASRLPRVDVVPGALSTLTDEEYVQVLDPLGDSAIPGPACMTQRVRRRAGRGHRFSAEQLGGGEVGSDESEGSDLEHFVALEGGQLPGYEDIDDGQDDMVLRVIQALDATGVELPALPPRKQMKYLLSVGQKLERIARRRGVTMDALLSSTQSSRSRVRGLLREDSADETPADETPAGETPAGETPAGETPAGETPAGETGSGRA